MADVRGDYTPARRVLGNCRAVAAYLPPAYGAPDTAATDYPVVYMHDGQNIFDDTDCCFDHTGWEVNLTADADIAAGLAAAPIIVASDHTGSWRFLRCFFPAE